MDNKKITLKQTVTDKDGNQQIKTISTYTDEAILASETNINEKISNLETNVENNTSKISANTAEIENLKAQGSTVSLLPLKQIIKNGTYSAVDDNVDGYAKVAVNIPSYPFVVTDVGTYYPKDGYLFDSVTLPDIPLENAFKSIGYTEIPEAFNASIEHSKELASKWNPSNTSVGNIFKNDKKLVYAPYIDTSNVTSMNGMFENCSSLTTIPALDTSNVTSMGYMFENCSSLIAIPALNTSKVTDMNWVFDYCASLTTIPALNTSNVTSMNGMFRYCWELSSILMTGTKCSFNISYTILKHDALVTLLNNLGTANSGATLTMGSSKLALLSDEEKKIATDKGWILA